MSAFQMARSSARWPQRVRIRPDHGRI
jgi:hypothetical protein